MLSPNYAHQHHFEDCVIVFEPKTRSSRPRRPLRGLRFRAGPSLFSSPSAKGSFSSQAMGTTMKGLYKGFKYTLAHIFVVKEREIEIGNPTDVKHVAHIGWDGPSGSAPTWMNEFKPGPEFAATSIGNSGSALSPWFSQDVGESTRQHAAAFEAAFNNDAAAPAVKKKQKRKKTNKSSSSPKSGSGSSSRSSRAKSKAKFVEGSNLKPTNIEVA